MNVPMLGLGSAPEAQQGIVRMAGDVSTTPDSTLKSLKVENQQDRERKNKQKERKKKRVQGKAEGHR